MRWWWMWMAACSGPVLVEPTGPGDGRDSTVDVPDDLGPELDAIDGLTYLELFAEDRRTRAYALTFEQPLSHDDPDGPSFLQHATLVHVGRDRPMTLVSTGYDDFLGQARLEPTLLLDTNQLVLEKRFHGASVPEPPEWPEMTVEAVATDAHTVRERLADLYPEPWIGTGHSLGGKDSVYHAYFWPEDLDAVLAYVAPFQVELADERFVPWFDSVPPADCQAALTHAQTSLLGPARTRTIAQLAKNLPEGLTFDRLGLVGAYENMVRWLPFEFWQYLSADRCAEVPGADPTVAELVQFVETTRGIAAGSDQALDARYDPYAWQVWTELGSPAPPAAHLEGLFQTTHERLLPLGAPEPEFVPVNPPVLEWLGTDAANVVLVYGSLDPWTAAAADVSANPAVLRFDVEGGNHGAFVSDLPEAEATAVWAYITDRTGVRAQATRVAPDLLEPVVVGSLVP